MPQRANQTASTGPGSGRREGEQPRAAAAAGAGRRRLPGTPPLGRLLVQRGVLGEVQLAIALKEQRRTGRQLGDLIVSMRFATADEVARALAAQRGGFVKSEHGVAFGAEPAARRPRTRQAHRPAD